MASKIFNRCLFGAPAGLTVWFFFHLWAAYLRGGELLWTSGHLVLLYGSELNAVTAQAVSAMVIGMIWASASLIWQETDWSLLVQTAVNCLLSTLPSLAIAWFMGWMPHSFDGIWQYVRLFGVIYLLIWAVQYLSIRKRVRQFNEKIKALEAN